MNVADLSNGSEVLRPALDDVVDERPNKRVHIASSSGQDLVEIPCLWPRSRYTIGYMLQGKKCADASRWLIVLALMLIAFSATEGQSALVLSEASGKRAAPNKIYDFEGWSFSIDGDAYEIDKVGKGSRVDFKTEPNSFSWISQGATI